MSLVTLPIATVLPACQFDREARLTLITKSETSKHLVVLPLLDTNRGRSLDECQDHLTDLGELRGLLGATRRLRLVVVGKQFLIYQYGAGSSMNVPLV